MKMELSSSSDTNMENIQGLRNWAKSPDIFDDDTYSEQEMKSSEDNIPRRKMDAAEGKRIRNCMNAFVNFTKRFRPYYKSKYPIESFFGITRRIGHHWASLSASEKEKYIFGPIESGPDIVEVKSAMNGESRHGDVTTSSGHGIAEVQSRMRDSSGYDNTPGPRHSNIEVKSLVCFKSRHGDVTAEPRHCLPEVQSQISTVTRHGNVTAGPRHSIAQVQSQASAELRRNNVTTGQRHCTTDARSQIGVDSGHGNATAGTRHDFGKVQSLVSVEARHANVTTGSNHGVTDVGSREGANSRHGTNVTTGHGIGEVISLVSADSRHGAGDNSSNLGNSGVYRRTSDNQSCNPITVNTKKSKDKILHTSDALNWTHQRPATSQIQINRICTVNPSRSQGSYGTSSVPYAQKPDAFSCVHDTIIGDSIVKTFPGTTDDDTLCYRKLEIIADGNGCPRSVSNHRGSSEARTTSTKKTFLASSPTFNSTIIATDWEYAGISCSDVKTRVFDKSSNSSNTKQSQMSNVGGNEMCTTVSSCVSNHIDSKCNDRNNTFKSKESGKHKRNKPIDSSYNRHKNKLCRRNESYSVSKSKRERRKEKVRPKSEVKRLQPKSPRARLAIGTNQENKMTGSILFSSGVKMKYRKILPKPLNIAVAVPTDPNPLDSNLLQDSHCTQSSHIKDEINKEIVSLAPREERAIESLHSDFRKQDKLIKPFHPKDEVCASIKRFIRTGDLKQSTRGQPTDKYKKTSNVQDTSCEGKQDLKNRDTPACKTFSLKGDKSTAIENGENKNYNVLIRRWTDWNISPINQKESYDVRNKSPVPNLVSKFPLQPEVDLRKEIDTIGSSDRDLEDMDFLIEGCDSPMWFSSGSSGTDTSPCADNSDLADRTVGASTAETEHLLIHPAASQRHQNNISSVDGICLLDSLQRLQKECFIGSPSHTSVPRHVSSISSNGPRKPILSDDILAVPVPRNVSSISSGGPGTHILSDDILATSVSRNVSSISSGGPGTHILSDDILATSVSRNVSSISSNGPRNPILSDDILAVPVPRNVSSIYYNGPGTPVLSDDILAVPVPRNVSSISSGGPGTPILSDDILATSVSRNVSSISSNGPGTPILSDDILATSVSRNVSSISSNGPGTPMFSNNILVMPVPRNVSSISSSGPGTHILSDNILAVPVPINVSSIYSNGPGTPVLSGDILAVPVPRNVSSISSNGPGTLVLSGDILNTPVPRNVPSISSNGPATPVLSDDILAVPVTRNVPSISSNGPGTPVLSDNILAVLVPRNVPSISSNGPGTLVLSGDILNTPVPRNVSSISSNGPGTPILSDDILATSISRNVSSISSNRTESPILADDVLAMQSLYQC